MDVAMVSSSGSLCDRRDRAGLGPRGSKPLAFGLFFFGGEGEGVFTSSTFAGFLKSRAKRPGFGGLLLSTTTASAGSEGVLGERGMLVVGCLSPGAASPRARRRRGVQYVLAPRLSPHTGPQRALLSSAALALSC